MTDGQTGWVFRADDSTALQEKLAAALAVLADPVACERIQIAVAGRISGYTYAATTCGLLAAMQSLDSPS